MFGVVVLGRLKELQFLGPMYFQQLSRFHPQQASKWSPPNQIMQIFVSLLINNTVNFVNTTSTELRIN